MSENQYRFFRYGTHNKSTGKSSLRRNLVYVANNTTNQSIFDELMEKARRITDGEVEEKIIEIYSFGNILDVGCGKNKRGQIGIDIKRNDGVDIIADARYLPFRTDSFDSIVCSHVLEHIELFQQALLEMKRVMKSSLILLIPRYKASFVHHDHVWAFKGDLTKQFLETLFFVEDFFTVGTSNIFLCNKYNAREENGEYVIQSIRSNGN